MKKIFLVDNFDSFTFNLVDYFKKLGCEVFVYRNDVSVERVSEIEPDLIVFSPGPSVPKNAGNMMEIIRTYHRSCPMFGVCLGHEAFIEFFGGSLKFVPPVHGKSSAISHDGKTIFSGLEENFMAGRYHSLCADKIPACFEVSAKCGQRFEEAGNGFGKVDREAVNGVDDSLIMAIRHKELPIESVQFHPESVLSMKGGSGFKMIENIVNNQFCNV